MTTTTESTFSKACKNLIESAVAAGQTVSENGCKGLVNALGDTKSVGSALKEFDTSTDVQTQLKKGKTAHKNLLALHNAVVDAADKAEGTDAKVLSDASKNFLSVTSGLLDEIEAKVRECEPFDGISRLTDAYNDSEVWKLLRDLAKKQNSLKDIDLYELIADKAVFASGKIKPKGLEKLQVLLKKKSELNISETTAKHGLALTADSTAKDWKKFDDSYSRDQDTVTDLFTQLTAKR